MRRDSTQEAAAGGGVWTAGNHGQTTGGLVTISLGKVLHVPKLERNLISERKASLVSGLLFMKSPTAAHLGTGKYVCLVTYHRRDCMRWRQGG